MNSLVVDCQCSFDGFTCKLNDITYVGKSFKTNSIYTYIHVYDKITNTYKYIFITHRNSNLYLICTCYSCNEPTLVKKDRYLLIGDMFEITNNSNFSTIDMIAYTYGIDEESAYELANTYTQDTIELGFIMKLVE